MSHTIKRLPVLGVSALILTVGLSLSAGSAPGKSLDADLVVKLVGQDGLLVYPGFPLSNSFKVILSNEGPKDALDFDVDVVLSQSRLLDGKTELLSRLRVSRLKGHASVELRFSKGFKIPEDAPIKKLYVGALADSGKTVNESSENNNAAVLAVQVQMKITSAYQTAESPQTEFYINGIGFGSAWANHQICFNGTPINITNHDPSTWKSNEIYIQAQGVACRQNYSLTISENGTPVSNAVAIYIGAVVGYLSPAQGPAGTAVHIQGHGFGAAQGGRTLKLGNAPVPVISSWSENDINCQIPSGLAPGTYPFSIWEGGNKVSITASYTHFTIL